MSLLETISADLRSRAGYCPPCPLCSFIGVQGYPNDIRGPQHRSVTFKATATHPERTIHVIMSCCSLSRTTDTFNSPSEAASWWRERRLQKHPDIATESRRVHCLSKLKDYEPL